MTQKFDPPKKTLSLNLSKVDPAKLQEKIQAAKENQDLNRSRKTLSLNLNAINSSKLQEKIQAPKENQDLNRSKKTLSLDPGKVEVVKVQERIQASKRVDSPQHSSFKKATPPPRNFPYNQFKTLPLTKAEKKRIQKEEAKKAREEAKKAKAVKHEKETKQAIKEGVIKRFANMGKALAWLQLTYPRCFNFSHPKPLTIGITNDILKNLPQDIDFSKMNIRQVLDYYTHSPKYLHILTKAKYRYNLQGEKEGDVTPIQQKKALEQAKKLYEYRKKVKLEKQQKHEEWKNKQKPKKMFQGNYEQLQQNVRAALKISCEDTMKRHWLLSDYKNKIIEEMFFHQSKYQFNIPSLLQNECKGLLFFLDTFPDKGILESIDYKTFEGNKSFWMVKTKTDLYRVWIRTGYVGVCGSLSHQIEGFFHQNKDLFRKEGIRKNYPFLDPASYVHESKTYPPQTLTSFMLVAFLNEFMQEKSEEVIASTRGKLDHLIQNIFKNNISDLPEDINDKETLISFCRSLYNKIKRNSKEYVNFKRILENIIYKASEPHPCQEEGIPISIIYNDFYIAGLFNKKRILLPLIKKGLKKNPIPNQTFILNRFTSYWIKEDEVIKLVRKPPP